MQERQARSAEHASGSSGCAAAAVGTKRKRKLKAAKPCRALGVAMLGIAAPEQAVAAEEQGRMRLRTALLCVRAAAASGGCIYPVYLPGRQPYPARRGACQVQRMPVWRCQRCLKQRT